MSDTDGARYADDVRILVVRNDESAPVGRLGDWLTAAGASLVEIDAAGGAPVPRTVPAGVAAVVPLGGEASADSDDTAPWLPDERALLVDARRKGVPVLGICLGSQLMGYAYGGVVRRADPGEAGITALRRTAAAAGDPLFAALPEQAPVAQYHKDEVAVLPPGATLLASTPACAHQVWQLDESCWAVQGHQEVDAGIVGGWTADDPEHARRCGSDPQSVVAGVAAHEDAVRDAWAPVAAAFVAVARRRASRGRR